MKNKFQFFLCWFFLYALAGLTVIAGWWIMNQSISQTAQEIWILMVLVLSGILTCIWIAENPQYFLNSDWSDIPASQKNNQNKHIKHEKEK